MVKIVANCNVKENIGHEKKEKYPEMIITVSTVVTVF